MFLRHRGLRQPGTRPGGQRRDREKTWRDRGSAGERQGRGCKEAGKSQSRDREEAAQRHRRDMWRDRAETEKVARIDRGGREGAGKTARRQGRGKGG